MKIDVPFVQLPHDRNTILFLPLNHYEDLLDIMQRSAMGCAMDDHLQWCYIILKVWHHGVWTNLIH